MIRKTAAVVILAAAFTPLFVSAGKGQSSQCLYRALGALPSLSCTPGVVNHAVTQATLSKTVCIPGWSTDHRPSVNVTEPEKLISMRQYGYAFGTSPKNYEYDHLIPISLGGALNDTHNMFPEPHHVTAPGGRDEGSFMKDLVEYKFWRMVCRGEMKLWQARQIMRTDWRKGI